MTYTLHPHQARAIERIRHSLASGHRRPMLQGPTAFGKTILMTAIFEGALTKGKRVLVTVPLIQLVDQTVEKLHKAGISDVGVIQGDHWMTDHSKPVQVASIQTLQRRKVMPEADLVIVDEAHRWFKYYDTWMASPEWQRVPFIGMSATPWTKGLGKHYDDLIVASTTKELIDAGYLAPFRVFAPSRNPNNAQAGVAL